MVDQVWSLRKRGVSAAILSGNKGIDECLVANDEDIEKVKFSLLFSAPEAIIGSERWRLAMLRPCLRDHVVAVAVDEAHCVSKW